MVYHNSSMSLNHHVPILNCTVTRRGLSLWFRHLSNCKERCWVPHHGVSAPPPKHTHWWQRFGTFMSSLNPLSLPLCVITCFGSCDLALYRLWALWFWITYPVSIGVHYRCSKGDTQLGDKPMKLPSVTVFRPFLTWKKHNLVFKLLLCSPPSSLFYGRPDPTFFLQAPRDLKWIFSPLLMNAKFTHVTWRRGSCVALSNRFSVRKICVCLAATWRDAMYDFWLSEPGQTTG